MTRKETEKITACIKCQHFFNAGKDTGWKNMWYNHFCLASPIPISSRFDSTTGRRLKSTEYRFCLDVNDGNCPKFKAI